MDSYPYEHGYCSRYCWCLHITSAAETYSTANGGNITMELNYVVPGGYVAGTFSGNMQNTAGAGVTISQGGHSAIPIN